MSRPQLFLSNLSKDQKEFLNLLDLTAKVHGESRTAQATEKRLIWNDEFFHLKESHLWQSLSSEQQSNVLTILSEKILQEAYFIESAGMAYAGKMNLAARSKEEREFYCFVGEEEAKHLRMIESLAVFDTSLGNIPSFALLIGEIIEEAKRSSHLLLIQILLEGWGLNYYKTLAKSALDESVEGVFKTIIKDEIRHHSAGVILFNQLKSSRSMDREEVNEFISYLERIAFMVKIGPFSVCEEVFKYIEHSDQEGLRTFLHQTNAVSLTAGKMELLQQLLGKSLPDEVLDIVRQKEILKPLDLSEMTALLYQSIPGIFAPR